MVRRIHKLNRNKPTRRARNIILIAAEGDNKTEAIYFMSFNQLQKTYRIQMANGNKTNPKGIVKDLINTMKREDIDLESGDLAICVFDTDTEESKASQIESARVLADKNGIITITSNPCFEVWFLEHYTYTSRCFNSGGDVIEELRKHVPGYVKNANMEPVLRDKTGTAIVNCKKLEDHHNQNGSKSLNRNPSSEVYKIVEMLIKK